MFSGDVLKGKRILVTGGGTGLGKEMSVGFAPTVRTSSFAVAGKRFSIVLSAKFASDRVAKPTHWLPTFAIRTASKK
jgi:NAD(P)-dependent dehydrogenase (short-subunit alcohol dehydrogenase family)